MTFLPIQLQKAQLYGSGITATDTSIELNQLRLLDGITNVTTAMIGEICYATISPGTTKEEQISFTGITQNASGTATLTGVTRGLDSQSPYAEDSDNKHSHGGGTIFVISNTSGFYSQFLAKKNNEIIEGIFTFPSANHPVYDSSPTFTPGSLQIPTVEYIDGIAIAGSPDMSFTTKGIAEEATEAEINADTAVGGTSARLAINPSTLATSKYGVRLPSANEKSGLVGASGLEPSSENKFIDEGSVSNAASQTATTIAFVDSDPDTITDSGSGFVTAGFRQGQDITVSGSTSNDGTYTIASVSAGTITLISTDSLTAEVAGDTVTIAAVKANKVVQFDAAGEVPLELGKTLTAFEGLTAGDLVKHIDDSGTSKMRKIIGEYPDYEENVTFNTISSSMGTNPSNDSVSAVALSDTLVIISYDDASASSYAYAHACTIAADGTITVGAKTTINNVDTNNRTALTRLTSTTFVIGYYASSATYYVHCSVSGTTITIATPVASGGNSLISAAPINATSFATVHKNGNAVEAQIGTLSGTVISFGTAVEVDATGIGTDNKEFDIAVLTESLLVVLWSETTTCYAAAATFSGSTIGAFGTPVSQTITDINGPIAIERLSDTEFLWAYITGSSDSKVRICSVSGTTITQGTAHNIFSTTNCTYIAICVINEWSFVVAYGRVGVGNLHSFEIQSDRNTLNMSSVQEFDTSGMNGGTCLATLTNLRVIVVWDDTGNPVLAKTVDFVAKDDRPDIDGIVEASTIAEDATGKICLAQGDVATGQTLTDGAMYYAQTDGTIGTTQTAYKIGMAISTTELIKLT